MKKINELINSLELEELKERDEFVVVGDAMESQEQDGITLMRWTIDV